ncbi:DeoR/GlpR family DNA-binding transcription regulator [Streptomyces sp. NPDC006798]|uniref:DeoR/GlpR family DNA-binding transcription regulator n=1 Tax=Streptomyces sp. NPDC006798 TaxID=3155462 RepID=UPI0033DCAF7F
MLPAERHRRISAVVDRAGTISTEDLAGQPKVSAETVRRDPGRMERRGVLRRVRGGAASLAVVRQVGGEEASFADRTASYTAAVQVADALPRDVRGTVVTPSLPVARVVSGRPYAGVLLPGARLRGGDLVRRGPDTVRFVAGIHPDLAFLGSGGIDATAGVTDFHYEEIASERRVRANSARSYVVADGSKRGRVAGYRVRAAGECTGVITDDSAAARLAAVAETGCEVLVV